jgi:hypothetical protein
MSFDVFLQRFAGGEPAEVDRDQVHAVLHARQYSDPNRFGYYPVTFPDGVDVKVDSILDLHRPYQSSRLTTPYRPTTLNGSPVEVETIITVTYTLNR